MHFALSICMCVGSFALTVLLGFPGSVSNVVLRPAVSEDNTDLCHSRSGALVRSEAVVHQEIDGLTSHGSPLHIVHLFHRVFQGLFVVVASQRELLPHGAGILHQSHMGVGF